MTSQEFISKIEKKEGYILRSKQISAIQEIEKGKDVLLVLPTSYGKTIPAIYACERAKLQGKKTIWLSPLKALSREHYAELSKYFKVFILTSDYRDQKDNLLLTPADVIIMTYEMFNMVVMNTSKRQALMRKIGCIVLDESHNICDEERGARLESTLKVLKVTSPHLQRILLSATIGNAEEFNNWLGSTLVYAGDDERPIPLKKDIITFEPSPNPKYTIDKKVMKLMDVLMQYKNANPQVLVFCSSRSRCEQLAKQFSRKWRCAYHHAGVNYEDQARIEKAFKEGQTQIIFTSPTLAQGINLPADICVIFDVTRWNYHHSQDEFISPNELKQMGGRAGRSGISQFGIAIAICEKSRLGVFYQLWNKLLKIKSQIPKHLSMILLQWITAGIKERNKLFEMYQDIFYNKEELTEQQFTESMNWLLKNKFIERNNFEYYVTWIGKMTTFLSIYPETTLHFLTVKNRIESLETITYNQLFSMIFNVDEFLDNIVVRRIPPDKQAVLTGESYLGDVDERLAKAYAMVFNDYFAQMHLAKRLPMSSTDLYMIKQSTTRIMNACAVIIGNQSKFTKEIQDLNKCVEAGIIDKDIIDLMELDMIGVKRAVSLFQNGIKTVQTFLTTDNAKLQSIIGLKSPTLEKIKSSISRLPNYSLSDSTLHKKHLEDF